MGAGLLPVLPAVGSGLGNLATGAASLGSGLAGATSKTGRKALKDVQGFFQPEFPPLEFPEDEVDTGPLVDDDEARLLAQQRRSLERTRRGRRSLRIDRPRRNPGISAGIGSGLRIT